MQQIGSLKMIRMYKYYKYIYIYLSPALKGYIFGGSLIATKWEASIANPIEF